MYLKNLTLKLVNQYLNIFILLIYNSYYYFKFTIKPEKYTTFNLFVPKLINFQNLIKLIRKFILKQFTLYQK